MTDEIKYTWTDNPTVSGISPCNTDILNDNLMYLKNRFDTQITNCLLEVPQRIKYELVDGTLTLKAGSVVIVPYGVEDLTETYPVGSTFINDNFKVFDTQWDGSKFFVWAEVQSDITYAQAITDNGVERVVYVRIGTNNMGALGGVTVSNTDYTGSANQVSWNTSTNTISIFYSGVVGTDGPISLPFSIVVSDGANINGSIKNVFNGVGYIGSTVWVDKGVKGLIPDGRNADGSLNDIQVTTAQFVTYARSLNGTVVPLWLSDTGNLVLSNGVEYNYNLNIVHTRDNVSLRHSYCQIAAMDLAAGVISNFQSKQPIRVADIQDVVRKAGDSMTGALELYGSSAHLGLFGGSIFTHNMKLSIDTPPTTNTYEPIIEQQDKDNVRKSRLESFWKTDGSHGIQLSEKHGSAYSAVTAGFDANGNPYTYAPHCDITNGIVTQAGIKKAASGYLKLGNGVIIAWGSFTPVSKNSGTVTLPVTFTSNQYALVATQNGSAPTDDYANSFCVKSRTTTNFTYQTGHTETPNYRYIAIGY